MASARASARASRAASPTPFGGPFGGQVTPTPRMPDFEATGGAAPMVMATPTGTEHDAPFASLMASMKNSNNEDMSLSTHVVTVNDDDDSDEN